LVPKGDIIDKSVEWLQTEAKKERESYPRTWRRKENTNRAKEKSPDRQK